MVNNFVLPKDLKKYVILQIWKKIKVCVFCEIILFITMIFWGDIFLPTKYISVRVVEYIAILILPLIFTRIPFTLIDSTYYGIIDEVKIRTYTDNDYLSYPNYHGLNMHSNNIIYLVIKTPSGEQIKKKVYSGKADLQQHINTYHKGDLVFHLYGTDNVIILPKASDTHVQCAVCGSINEVTKHNCRNCNHTLIKNI